MKTLVEVSFIKQIERGEGMVIAVKRKTSGFRWLLLFITLVLPVALIGPGYVPTAKAALCSSTDFADCEDKGYSTHGYDEHYTTGHWGMFGGHNCTNYVAYALQTVNGVAPITGLGNADAWDDNARDKGISVNKSPSVGSVAQWDSGHVAYVESVYVSGAGTITVTYSEDDYYTDLFAWKTMTYDPDTSSIEFIHFGDMTDAPAMYTADNGDIWLVGVNRLGELYHRKYTASTSSWGSAVLHSSGWSAKSSPSITMDEGGRVWIAAVKLNGTLYAKYFDTSWHTLDVVSEKVSIDAGVNMVARSNGNVSVVFVMQDANIRHATMSTSNVVVSGAHFSGSWSTSSMPALTVDTSSTMWAAAVKESGVLYAWKVGSPNDLHADSFSGMSTNGGVDLAARTNGNVTLVAVNNNKDLYHITYNPNMVDSSSGTHGDNIWSTVHSPAVTEDNSGRLWLAGVSTGGTARSYVYDNGQWDIAVIGTDFLKFGGLDLQKRTNGNVIVGGINDSRQIVHSSWSGSAWGTPTVHPFN